MTTFAPIFVPAALREATSDAAWLQAMLDAERALALAESRLGLIPADAADSIAASCRAELFDIAELAETGRGAGNPVEPLVRALRERVGGVAAAASTLAEEHARTPMAARTLLQQAVPTTFGYKAAAWLLAVLDARAALATIRHDRLAAQLGGAAGTLAAFGDDGLELAEAFANELQLPCPVAPWHSDRSRIAELGAALELAAGAVSKIALDVVLLAQTEVGEAWEGDGGVSSTMPQKRNPIRSAVTIACARGVDAAASLLRGGMAHVHETAGVRFPTSCARTSECPSRRPSSRPPSIRRAISGPLLSSSSRSSSAIEHPSPGRRRPREAPSPSRWTAERSGARPLELARHDARALGCERSRAGRALSRRPLRPPRTRSLAASGGAVRGRAARTRRHRASRRARDRTRVLLRHLGRRCDRPLARSECGRPARSPRRRLHCPALRRSRRLARARAHGSRARTACDLPDGGRSLVHAGPAPPRSRPGRPVPADARSHAARGIRDVLRGDRALGLP